MPNKHFYVAMGAANGALVAVLVRHHRQRLFQRYRWMRQLCRRRPDWFLFFPVIYLPFIVWALIPDILHATAILPKDVTRGPLFDIFYLHSSFERWEDSHRLLDRILNGIGSLCLLTIGIGNFVYYIRAYRRRVSAAAATAAPTGD